MKPILLIIFVFIGTSGFAQSFFSNTSTEFKAGVFNNREPNSGLCLGIEIKKTVKNHTVFSAQLTGFDEGAFSIWGSYNDDIYSDFTLKVGKQYQYKFMKVEALTGLGAVWGTKWGVPYKNRKTERLYTDYDFVTIGVPLDVGFKIIPFRGVAIGYDFQLNLNVEVPLYIQMLTFEVDFYSSKSK